MKNMALALALVLAGSSLAVGLASTDANAGGRKICKQALAAHPMAGKHRELRSSPKQNTKLTRKPVARARHIQNAQPSIAPACPIARSPCDYPVGWKPRSSTSPGLPLNGQNVGARASPATSPSCRRC